LIADEPTANLDHDNAQRIMNVFRDFNRVGVTTLIASHDQELMARYATRTLRIDPGKFADSHGPSQPPDAGQAAATTPRTGSRAEPGMGFPGEPA
ncbi:MAG TPA: cell division ATP-binding protein FtsE, partial [Achromobacter sp.]|nr:cell division ATP-binding protein FtsE [Achromobacter sp.]